MRKKLLLIASFVMLAVLMLAISIGAQALPNESGEKFTLSDGTALPLWDVEGNGLIWYKSTANTSDGYASYDYVANNQFDTSVTPNITYAKATYTRGVAGVNYKGYQLNGITITTSSGTYTSKSKVLVVVNLYGSLYDGQNAFTMFSKNFTNETALEAVYLDPRTQFILSSTFQGCTSLRKVNLEDTALIEAGEAAFCNCTSLSEIVLPNTTKVIGHYPFQSTAITEFTIPDSVVSVSGSAQFNGCKSLTNIYGLERLFSDGVLSTLPGSIFKDCTKLQMPFEGGIFPSNITEIGASAFQGCTSIGDTIILPNGLTKIGQSSFNGCTSVKKLVLGASFTTWASYDGFKNCSSLKEVYIPATMKSIAGNVFNVSASDCVFYFTGTKAQLDSIKANTNTNNTAFLNAYNKALSVEEFDALESKSGRYIVYGYNICKAFYGDVHDAQISDIVYANGFDKYGELIGSCSLCSSDFIEEIKPIISVYGFASNKLSNRIVLTNGYKINVDAVDLYNEVKGATLEIGIFFTTPSAIGDTKPTSVESFPHFSNNGNNVYATLDYIIRFPSKDSADYARYAVAEFVASAFIYDGTEYYFFQGSDNETTESVLSNGFTTTTLSKITGDVPDVHVHNIEWVVTPATCTAPAEKIKTCTECGELERFVDESAPGHVWGAWQEGFLYAERSCTVDGCGQVHRIDYQNITNSAKGSVTFEGQAWADNAPDSLFDGNWDDRGIAPKGCEVSAEIILKSGTYIDRIYVKGYGGNSAKFTVSVLYEDQGDYVSIGSGSFLTLAENENDDRDIPYVAVDPSRKVLSVLVKITNAGYGTDYWQEVAFIKTPDISQFTAKETVTVTYNTGIGTFENDFDYERFVAIGGGCDSHPTPQFENETKLFTGWYKDINCTIPVTAGDTYSRDTVIYAGWIDNTSCNDGTNNHSVSDWSIISAPTCNSLGSRSGVCTACGKTITESIETTAHTESVVQGVAPNCIESGLTDEIVCSVCGTHISGGELIAPNGIHTYNENDWTTVIQATKYTNGLATGNCSVCLVEGEKVLPYTATADDLALVGENVKYTGGQYTNAIFTNVAPLGRVFVTSFFSGTKGGYLIDKDSSTFWNADTFVDGADYTADYIELDLPVLYDIGIISLTIPNYTAYSLGEGCYVSYDIEYLDEASGNWVYIGSVSDKDATSVGANCKATLTLDAPITAQHLRAKVTHASRYAPAVVYEFEVFAKANNFEYDIKSVIGEANVSISGKYNDWVNGAEAFVDGDLSTGWLTDIRNGGPTWALIEFGEDTYIACLQIAIKTSSSRIFKVEVYENGQWIQLGGNYACTGTIGGNIISNANGISTFNIDVEKSVSKIKFSVVSDPGYWECYVYEIAPYSVIGATTDASTTECKHTLITSGNTVAPTCVSTGYTVMTCSGCGVEFKTNAKDTLTHSFGEYTIATYANATTIGTKVASCSGCGATSTITYEESYDAPLVTPYLHDAPAAWAQTFDDGNYSDTYDWVIPQLQKYGYRATAMLSVFYTNTLVSAWNERLESGVFDIGSHSYSHTSVYNGSVSSTDLLNEVVKAQSWFRSNFLGQKVLTFAAPNGATSDDVAKYLTGIFAANRNGGQGYAFYNVISDLENGRTAWGNLNSYVSKADQTEGEYVFSNYNGSLVYTLDENGNYVLNTAYANKNINYVFNNDACTFVNEGFYAGTYYYVAEDYRYDFYETGSYNLVDGEFVFVNDNSGDFKLVKASIGSYEKAIDTLVSKNAFTVECLHSLGSGSIYSSYNSTISKFEYLAKRGVWAPSYQDLILYLKEAQSAKIETISRTQSTLALSVTDELDNYMFNHAITIKVDIDDSWTDITVRQNGVEIPLVDIATYRASKNMSTVSCAIEDGYIYIDVIPDGGNIVITKSEITITEKDENSAEVGADFWDIIG